MQAAYLVRPGEIEIRDVPTPQPAEGEVVLRVERALTCGTDLKAYRRGHPLIPMPGPLGHQYAGIVERVGRGVAGFEPGEPVWGVNSAPCMQCRFCHRRRYNLCRSVSQELLLGAFAQYLRIPRRVVEQNLLPRPGSMPAWKAAFLEPVSCVVHALRAIAWRDVERVLVVGLGSMGLLFTQLLPRFTSAVRVGTGRNVGRLALARKLGIDQAVCVDEGPPREQLAGDGFDCVIECTGKPEGWKTAFEAVDAGGQVMFFGGLPKGTTFEADAYRLHYEEVRLLGSFHFTPLDVRAAAEIFQDDVLQLDELVSGEMPLRSLPEALEKMATGAGIKYAIDPGRDSAVS
ncbi:MAG: zinc-dependent alcohol dehydrogenase [Pirellulales bacterium]